MTQPANPFQTGPSRGLSPRPDLDTPGPAIPDSTPSDPGPATSGPATLVPAMPGGTPTGDRTVVMPQPTTPQVAALLGKASADAGNGVARPAASPAESPPRSRASARRAGETTIADEVVEKIAGIAVRKVSGVYDLAGDVSRLPAGVRERTGIGESAAGRGVWVKLTGRTAKVGVTLVVEYGYPVYDVADRVREDLADAVERMLGIEVTEVDVVVEDIHLPEPSNQPV